jgi:hypothetical protein
MSDQRTEFKSRQDVLDEILAAREAQQDAWDSWFAVRDERSAEYESARAAYMSANLEVNRLIEVDDRFRAQELYTRH